MIKFLGHEKIPLDQLETFPGNANIGNVAMIGESLAANGQYRSLIVREQDSGYTVLAGNHTKLAMVEHGAGVCGRNECGLCGDGLWDGAPRCEVFECSDDEALKINLADNRISEFSKRDDQALADLLMSLEDMSGSGYTADDLRLYLPQDPPAVTHVEFDAVQTEPDRTVTLTFKVMPEIRSRFLELTEGADDPSDPASRFEYLLSKAHG